ncbi:MAG: quinoprotein dehydrogenase-associated SoxYZ-like carrier [Proteobacteria bacterium]|nr:quinoprotein dehydrogenase-associated SoxYZ-like carrier [Pseudomonadota bacterium]
MKTLNVCKLTLPAFLSASLTISTAVSASPDDPLDSPNWEVMHKNILSNENVVFDERVKVIAPERAEDPMNVPVSVRVNDISDIEEIRVFADLNPISEIMSFYPGESQPYIGFRIRVEQATPVRAAVLTKDGVWHVGGRWIDASGGGCTQPSNSRIEGGWEETLGNVTSRLWISDNTNHDRLRFKVMHPMDTGLADGIPAFYIKRLELIDNNNVVLTRIEPNVAISENPVFSLDLDIAPEQKITLIGQDNNGNKINQVLYE